ncbi:MAG TPA: ABC transporter permease [Acidimicrobiales bacterium]|jgi:ABC-type polysaccharide/polyol phosphate export permease
MSVATGFELTPRATSSRSLLIELWRSRDLVRILSRKEFFVRYRRASFGLLWAVGLPLFQAVVIAVVFSRLAHLRPGTTNYVAFILAGLVGWTYFSSTLGTGSTAVVDGSSLTSRIYFPRMVLPLVTVGSNLYGYLISLVVVVGICFALGVPASPRLLLLVPATVLLVALTAALCLTLAALHVYFRDVRWVVQASLLAWMYVTPVIYPLDRLHGLAHVLWINPATGMVELFHAAIVGTSGDWIPSVWCSLGWVVALFVVGIALFRRFDRVFVDLL